MRTVYTGEISKGTRALVMAVTFPEFADVTQATYFVLFDVNSVTGVGIGVGFAHGGQKVFVPGPSSTTQAALGRVAVPPVVAAALSLFCNVVRHMSRTGLERRSKKACHVNLELTMEDASAGTALGDAIECFVAYELKSMFPNPSADLKQRCAASLAQLGVTVPRYVAHVVSPRLLVRHSSRLS